MFLPLHLLRSLSAAGNVASEGGERTGDGAAKRRHNGDKGEAHGCSNKTILNCCCARFVLEEFQHVESPLVCVAVFIGNLILAVARELLKTLCWVS